MRNPRGVLNHQVLSNKQTRYIQAIICSSHCIHAGATRLEVRSSNLIEDVCDVTPGRSAGAWNKGVYVAQKG